jgi:hypothetical protein
LVVLDEVHVGNGAVQEPPAAVREPGDVVVGGAVVEEAEPDRQGAEREHRGLESDGPAGAGEQALQRGRLGRRVAHDEST